MFSWVPNPQRIQVYYSCKLQCLAFLSKLWRLVLLCLDWGLIMDVGQDEGNPIASSWIRTAWASGTEDKLFLFWRGYVTPWLVCYRSSLCDYKGYEPVRAPLRAWLFSQAVEMHNFSSGGPCYVSQDGSHHTSTISFGFSQTTVLWIMTSSFHLLI